MSEMNVSSELMWELIIVDNNSTDNTKNIVDGFAANTHIKTRYLFEKNQGVSFAKNLGIKYAQGDIIAFTDDDVIVDKTWLTNISKAFEASNAICIGGKILPFWEVPPPRWLTKDLYFYLALVDHGETILKMTKATIYGANFAVRSAAFKKYGLFNTAIGRTAGKLYGGDETEFIQRLIDAGEEILYLPDIIVHHCISSDRLKKSYFRKWLFDCGEQKGLLLGNYVQRSILGIPFYAIRQTAHVILSVIISSVFNYGKLFDRELLLMHNIGFIKGRFLHRKSKENSAI